MNWKMWGWGGGEKKENKGLGFWVGRGWDGKGIGMGSGMGIGMGGGEKMLGISHFIIPILPPTSPFSFHPLFPPTPPKNIFSDRVTDFFGGVFSAFCSRREERKKK